jgi:hypothetical protein
MALFYYRVLHDPWGRFLLALLGNSHSPAAELPHLYISSTECPPPICMSHPFRENREGVQGDNQIHFINGPPW